MGLLPPPSISDCTIIGDNELQFRIEHNTSKVSASSKTTDATIGLIKQSSKTGYFYYVEVKMAPNPTQQTKQRLAGAPTRSLSFKIKKDSVSQVSHPVARQLNAASGQAALWSLWLTTGHYG